MKKEWMIISWSHDNNDNGASTYGRYIAGVNGTREEAEQVARTFIPTLSPIGIVEEITR